MRNQYQATPHAAIQSSKFDLSPSLRHLTAPLAPVKH